ncbi:MAG: flagellar basal body-associated FliL family protein [Lachnospiraceae bacterium]|nr:flagellar basal body-associated FliL family protein [Lachnospiraceae bacterium]
MKKNLITVIILALCVVNLILNILLVFVCMPSAKKTNNLITEIASVLNLELESNKGKNSVELKNIATFDIEKQVVNLKDDGSGKSHFVQVGITLELDSSAEDYADLNTVLTNSTGAVFDEARDVIQGYTISEISDQKTQEKVKKQILEKLQNKYGTRCIYNVSFSSFTTQ